MVGDQIVPVAELEGEALQAFFDPVSGSASESLGDGEAATLAFAHWTGRSATIDEKKATRLSADRFTTLRLATTWASDFDPSDCGCGTLKSPLLFGALASTYCSSRDPVRPDTLGSQFTESPGLRPVPRRSVKARSIDRRTALHS
jgi:hypothetical protein